MKGAGRNVCALFYANTLKLKLLIAVRRPAQNTVLDFVHVTFYI